MTLDPKSQFLKFQPASAEAWRAEAEKSAFQNAVVFGLAEMAAQGATAEQMQGAVQLVKILGGIAEPKVEVPKLPVRTLTTFEPKPPEKKG